MDAIMRESSFAQYLMQRARKECAVEGILDVLEIRFDPNAANQFAAGIRAIDDLQRLKQLLRSAAQVDSLNEFQRELNAE